MEKISKEHFESFKVINRETKYRCYNIGSRFATKMFSWEEMIDTLYSEINPRKSLFAPFINSDQFKENPWIILMQYTGIKDKNGKEIYEGDILATSNDGKDGADSWEESIIGDVVWDNEESCFSPMPSNYDNSIYDREYCYIIGNIHEDKDLIK